MDADHTLKILFVEDSPQDAELTDRFLRKSGLRYESTRVDTEAAFVAALESMSPDIVISDYMMPSFDGMRALNLTRQHDALLPFIILTGSMNEDTAVACMKAGASDYVIKEHIARLPFAITEALELCARTKANEEAERQLKESQERYRAIFEDGGEPMFIVDPSNGAIVDANKAATAFYGWPRERLLAMSIFDICTHHHDKVMVDLRRAADGELIHGDHLHRRADGSEVPVRILANRFIANGKTYLMELNHDISLRVAAEKDRDALSQKLEHYLSSSPTITYSIRLQNGKPHWEWVSENVTDILGYATEEVLSDGWWFDNIHAAERANALKSIGTLVAQGHRSTEYQFYRKDRTLVYLRDDMRLAGTEGDSTEIIGTLTDISDYKRLEAEARLKNAAVESAYNAVVITDRNGDIRWVNSAFERLTGYTAAEASGKNPRDLIRSGLHGQEFYAGMWDTILSGNVWAGEMTNRKKSGELYREEMTITPLLDEQGKVANFIAIKNDITERALAQERIAENLKEKEALLREIHHRVKNNLQIIASLMSLAMESNDDPAFCALVEDLNRRIETMAIVHEQFYEAEDIANIDFSGYMERLASGLLDEFGSIGIAPRLEFAADPASLPLEAAIPAGLIVSELIAEILRCTSEAAGHDNVLQLRLVHPTSDAIEISLQHRGVETKPDPRRLKAREAGLNLVHVLCDQLHAQLSHRDTEDGTSYGIRFSLPRTPSRLIDAQGES